MSHTAASLKKQTVAELREMADELGIDTDEVKRKQDLIDAILAADEEEEDDDLELDDEEEEDDEVEAEEEEEEDELDEVDEVEEEPAPKKAEKRKRPEPTGDTYTAKQVATRIGTDSKTLRKFFRSPASTIEPVGQGGRYEFEKADLPVIQAEFEKWTSTQKARQSKKKDSAPKSAPVIEEIEEDDDDMEFDEAELELDEDEDGNDTLDLDDEEDDEEED